MWENVLDSNFPCTITKYGIWFVCKATAELEEGISDVLIGNVPLVLLVVTSSYDVTIAYKHVNLKMFFSVSKSYSWNGQGTDKFLALGVIENGPCAAANYGCVLVCQ